MNNFKNGGFRQRDGNSGGHPKFGGKFRGGRAGDDRSGGRTELFPAVCSECRKKCEVPFRPTGDKPVYCRDCFGKQRQVPGRNSNGRDRQGRDFRVDAHPQREYQPQHARTQNDGGIDELKRHLTALESKVDRILELVSRKTENIASSVPVIKETSQVVKAVKAEADGAKAHARKVVAKTKE